MLVVDDNPGDQLLARIAIEEVFPNVDILEAYDGREALALLAELPDPPDIIFLDINMPGMDGFEFLERYEKFGENQTVVAIVSSSNDERDRERAAKFACVKYQFMKSLDGYDLAKLDLCD